MTTRPNLAFSEMAGLRKQTEQQVSALLRQFEENTGLRVADVRIGRLNHIDGISDLYSVSLDVNFP